MKKGDGLFYCESDIEGDPSDLPGINGYCEPIKG